MGKKYRETPQCTTYVYIFNVEVIKHRNVAEFKLIKVPCTYLILRWSNKHIYWRRNLNLSIYRVIMSEKDSFKLVCSIEDQTDVIPPNSHSEIDNGQLINQYLLKHAKFMQFGFCILHVTLWGRCLFFLKASSNNPIQVP